MESTVGASNGIPPKEQLDRSYRRAWLAIVVLILTLPFIGWGVFKAMGSHSNDPRQWLPRGFNETELYRHFQDEFGRDEITVVTWDGCTLDDSRVEELAAAVVGEAMEMQKIARPEQFDGVHLFNAPVHGHCAQIEIALE